MLKERAKTIMFGTDGWRAVIAQDFTFDNVRLVAQALAYTWDVDFPEKNGLVMVGYDTRFLSKQFAQAAAEVMAANGFRVMLASHPCSSPAISWSVNEHGAAGAIMITASHNPPEYNGFKIKAHYGGSASPELTAKIEAELASLDRVRPYHGEKVEHFDPRSGYFAQLGKLVDLPAITAAGIHVVVDSMHGAGATYLQTMLAGHEITELHAEPNPGFGGVNPEPIAANLGELVGTVKQAAKQHPLTVGLALDGDADRIGAVDATGEFINSHQILSLILQHLVEVKGWKGGVIRTFSTSRMVEKLATQYGLPLYETPIGFKYVCDLMLREDILVGGEESGGIGIKNHLPERDGVLAALLLLEIMAKHRATLGELVARLEATHGSHKYHRIDLHLADNAVKDRILDRLKNEPPTEVAGALVAAVESLDGVKLSFADGAWLLFRASGTEPLLRIYSEAPTLERVHALLEAGRGYAQGVQA